MSCTLSPDVGKPISKETADRWIQNYLDSQSDINVIRARFFGTDIIEELLSQDKCVGMRIYYAVSDEGEKQLLLVGAREDGTNIWPLTSGANTVTDKDSGLIVDASNPCPPYC